MAFSQRAVRHLGLGLLVGIVAAMSLMGALRSIGMDRELQVIHQVRGTLTHVDRLLAEFVRIRGDLTTFVIQEDTDLRPLLAAGKALNDEATLVLESLENEEHRRLIEGFIQRLAEHRAVMVAYSQELAIRRTGDGVRSREEALLRIETEAHRLISELKGQITSELEEMNLSVLELSASTRNLAAFLGTFGVLVGVLVAIWLQRALSQPIRELVGVSESIAAGDLTYEAGRQKDGKDEIGMLASAIGAMVMSLQRIVREIQVTAREVNVTAANLDRHTSGASEGASRQGEEIEVVSASVRKMDEIVREINEKVNDLTDSLEGSSSSADEIAQSGSVVSELADSLADEVERISSALFQMNAGMGQIIEHLDALSDSSHKVSSIADELAASGSQVLSHARQSTSLADGVRRLAEEEAGPALADLSRTSGRNKELVLNYSTLIQSLGNRSASIGQIIEVISNVAEQTNLLALNAAIIAAQAGEHGRSFAVVADEIRNLAKTTSSSVREIDDVIQSVQGEVEEAVTLIAEVMEGAEQGIVSSDQAGKILQTIVEHAKRSAGMAKEIADSALRQVERSEEVLSEAGRNTEQVLQIKGIMSEYKGGSDHILRGVEEVKGISNRLKGGTMEQAKATGIISRTLSETHVFAMEIGKAMQEEQELSRQMVDSLYQISQVAEQNLSAVASLGNMVARLRSLSGKLEPEVARFKLPEDGSPKKS